MGSSNSSPVQSLNRLFIVLVLSLLTFAPPPVLGCFTSIFNFGDSLSDTGNLFGNCVSEEPPHSCFPPYGDAFFHHPTGRFSNGRLIVDFIAQSLGLPLLPPYLSVGRRRISIQDFEKGLNFAVAGATALDESVLREKGITNLPTNYSLGVQMEWFKNTYSSVCKSSSTATAKCRAILERSLIVVGEIGGNDYNYAFIDERQNIDEIKSLVTPVVKAIGSAITELIKLGAQTLMVPGNLPIGCNPTYLKVYGTSVQNSENGCVNWLNEFSEYHNEQLLQELKQIRALYPHIRIIYADYYNSAMLFYDAPQDFGTHFSVLLFSFHWNSEDIIFFAFSFRVSPQNFEMRVFIPLLVLRIIESESTLVNLVEDHKFITENTISIGLRPLEEAQQNHENLCSKRTISYIVDGRVMIPNMVSESCPKLSHINRILGLRAPE